MREYNITGASIWLLANVYVAETITWFGLLVGSCHGVSDTRAIPHSLGKDKDGKSGSGPVRSSVTVDSSRTLTTRRVSWCLASSY